MSDLQQGWFDFYIFLQIMLNDISMTMCGVDTLESVRQKHGRAWQRSHGCTAHGVDIGRATWKC